jgi:hypothetical protein
MGAFPYRYLRVTLDLAPFSPPRQTYHLRSGALRPFFGFIAEFSWRYRDRLRLDGLGRETPIIRGMAVERSHEAWERYHLYDSRSWAELLSFHCKRFRPTTSLHPNVALRRDRLTPRALGGAIRRFSPWHGSAPANPCIGFHRCPPARVRRPSPVQQDRFPVIKRLSQGTVCCDQPLDQRGSRRDQDGAGTPTERSEGHRPRMIKGTGRVGP